MEIPKTETATPDDGIVTVRIPREDFSAIKLLVEVVTDTALFASRDDEEARAKMAQAAEWIKAAAGAAARLRHLPSEEPGSPASSPASEETSDCAVQQGHVFIDLSDTEAASVPALHGIYKTLGHVPGECGALVYLGRANVNGDHIQLVEIRLEIGFVVRLRRNDERVLGTLRDLEKVLAESPSRGRVLSASMAFRELRDAAMRAAGPRVRALHLELIADRARERGRLAGIQELQRGIRALLAC